jgi:hypothetical protein
LFFFHFRHLYVVLNSSDYRRFPPIFLHFRLFFASEYNNVVPETPMLYRKRITGGW